MTSSLAQLSLATECFFSWQDMDSVSGTACVTLVFCVLVWKHNHIYSSMCWGEENVIQISTTNWEWSFKKAKLWYTSDHQRIVYLFECVTYTDTLLRAYVSYLNQAHSGMYKHYHTYLLSWLSSSVADLCISSHYHCAWHIVGRSPMKKWI